MKSLEHKEGLCNLVGGCSIEEFLTKMNPSVQLQIATNEHECFMGNYPTIAQLNTIYGSKAPTMWLLPQLYNLSEYCGVKNKLEGTPIVECATIIANTFFYLKTSELMLFFYRFKAARYGKFYGNVDPMVIISSLRIFVTERNAFLEQVEAKKREEEMEEHKKNAVTYEEYVRIKSKNKK